MKAREVLRILNITRTTLYNYVKDNKIIVTKLDNGYYDYDQDSVFKLLKKDNRYDIIYARVSTYKQKNDLKNQINFLKKYCKDNNITIQDKYIYNEIHSGIELDRPILNNIINDVINMKIKNIYITNRDRLTRLSFKTLEFLFDKYSTKIIPINEESNKSNDSEIFEELLSLLHIFSTSMYSNRRITKLDIYKQDIQNFINE
jgi:predicted site-specific integrase-resolvase